MGTYSCPYSPAQTPVGASSGAAKPAHMAIPAQSSFITPHTAYFDRYPPPNLSIQAEPVPALDSLPVVRLSPAHSPRPDSLSNSNSKSKSHSNSHSHSHSHSNSNSNSNSNPISHSNSLSNSTSKSHSSSHSNPNLKSHSNSHSTSNPNFNPNSHSSPNSIPIPNPNPNPLPTPTPSSSSNSNSKSNSNSLVKKLSKLSLKSIRSNSSNSLKPDVIQHPLPLPPSHLAHPPRLSNLSFPIRPLHSCPFPPPPFPSASPPSSPSSPDSFSLGPSNSIRPKNNPFPLRSVPNLERPSSSPSSHPPPSSPPIHSLLSRSFSLNPLSITPEPNHSLYPFPSSSSSPCQTDNASLRSSSESSIGDLFAGPRTSLHYDPSTYEVLSAANDVSDIDALVDTFNHPAPSPDTRSLHDHSNHSHRLIKSRSKPNLSRHFSPAASSSSTHTIHSPCQPSHLRKKQASIDLALSAAFQNHASLHSDCASVNNFDLQPAQLANADALRDSDSARSGSSSSNLHHLRNPCSLTHLPDPPPKPHSRSAKPIPTIDEIVQRHALLLKKPPRQSSIPINGLRVEPAVRAEPRARSIDEIVEAYTPLVKSQRQRGPSASDVTGPASVHQQTERRESESSECSDGSINSVTREAMRHLTLSRGLADKLDSPHPGNMPDPALREPEPAPRTHPKPAADTAEEDLEMARYLRSPRLTTLLQLERQPSRMTVSLADVGAPAGHPVIIFLGLGCVRYLVGLYDELAEALGLRLVCIDRWGLGKTSTVADEERGFLEWAGVVEEVADQLGLGQFSILAHSAGAPYALATSLRLGTRVRGSIHLLAPWVSMSAEGGANAGNYRWLKYVPNSMIRTAQAAEWKVQGWRLGKPPVLSREPVGYDVRAPVCSADRDKERERARADGWGSDCERASGEGVVRPSIESRISDWSRLSSETKGTGGGGRVQGSPKGLLSKVFAGGHTGRAESVANSEESSRLGAQVEGLKTKQSTQSMSRSMGSGKSSVGDEVGRRRVLKSSSSGTKASSDGVRARARGGVPGALLGVSLLRASYAESLKGGTSELMAILERGAKPWGFSYSDVVAGVKVWHGSKDERISVRCAEWVCEVVGGKSELVVVEGVGHSLLMEVKVVVEVLESICEDWK